MQGQFPRYLGSSQQIARRQDIVVRPQQPIIRQQEFHVQQQQQVQHPGLSGPRFSAGIYTPPATPGFSQYPPQVADPYLPQFASNTAEDMLNVTPFDAGQYPNLPNDQAFVPEAAAFTSLESESELILLRAQLQESNRDKIAAQRQLALKDRQEKARIIQAQQQATSSVQQATDKTKRSQLRARQQQAELKRLRELKILREEQEREKNKEREREKIKLQEAEARRQRVANEKEIKDLRRSLNLDADSIEDSEENDESDVFTDDNIDLDDQSKPYLDDLMNLDDESLENILLDDTQPDSQPEYEVKSTGKRANTGTKLVIQKKKPKVSSGDSSLELKDSLNSSQESSGDLVLTDDEILAIPARHLSPGDKRRRSLLLQKRRQDVYIQGLRRSLGDE